jgi:putative tryptophan/tyrosine transport system substrate-binding protein
VFITGVCAATALPLATRAQQSGRTYRIAVLASFPTVEPAFYDELLHNGFVRGHNLLVDQRGAGAPISELEAIAAELVKTNPDAVVTFGPPATFAVQHATKSIPILAFTNDLVRDGLVNSMSQPDGNTTGVCLFVEELDAKRLEILHEFVPTARPIGILADAAFTASRVSLDNVASELGLEIITREIRRTDDIVPAIDALAAAHVLAINVLSSPSTWAGRKLIIDRTRDLRLPTIYQFPELAHQGGLIGFGPSLDEAIRLLARQVMRALNGAALATLPVVQPTKIMLAINLKAAKALGLTVPPALLARADEVIE